MAPHPSNRVRAVKPTETRHDMTLAPRTAALPDNLQVSMATLRPLQPRHGSPKTRSPQARVRGKIVGCRVHTCRHARAVRPAGPSP